LKQAIASGQPVLYHGAEFKCKDHNPAGERGLLRELLAVEAAENSWKSQKTVNREDAE